MLLCMKIHSLGYRHVTEFYDKFTRLKKDQSFVYIITCYKVNYFKLVKLSYIKCLITVD